MQILTNATKAPVHIGLFLTLGLILLFAAGPALAQAPLRLAVVSQEVV